MVSSTLACVLFTMESKEDSLVWMGNNKGVNLIVYSSIKTNTFIQLRVMMGLNFSFNFKTTNRVCGMGCNARTTAIHN